MITRDAAFANLAERAASSYLATGLFDLDAARIAIAKRRCKKLIHFVELFWPVVEPLQPFVKGWVQELVCTHLEAVTAEQIQNILFNVPPGFSKSTLVNVFWPAYEWGPMQRPDLRYIAWSYSAELTKRDNVLCRKIIESPLYQRMWGQCAACVNRNENAKRCKSCEKEKRFRLDGDQNAKTRYRNDWGGFRFASSVGGAGTGERADRLIFDDPHSVQGGESDVKRQATIDWFAATLPTRIRNSDGQWSEIKLPEWVRRAHQMEDSEEDKAKALRSATVGIMQRVHLHDVSGVILATPELGYQHVLVEMEYQGDKHPARVPDPDTGRVPSPGTILKIEDPRKARLALVPRDLEVDVDAVLERVGFAAWWVHDFGPLWSGIALAVAELDLDALNTWIDVARVLVGYAMAPQWWTDFANLWTRITIDIITLADPIRYPRHAVEKLKKSLALKSGADADQAQLQQWPQEVGGLYFPRQNIDDAHMLSLDDLLPPKCGFMTRGWDLASTDQDPRSAATVGVLGYIDIKDRVIIVHVTKVRGGPEIVDQLIEQAAAMDHLWRFPARADFPRDPGQAGKYQINAFAKGPMMGEAFDFSPEGASKETRAYPLSSQWKVGNVYIVRGDWNTEYLKIMSQFPVGRFKDEVDASTRMFDSQVRAEPLQKPMAPRTIKIGQAS